MEKERLSFIEDKKCKHLKKSRIIEMLKTERNNLKDELNCYEQGPFAKKTIEVFDYQLNRSIFYNECNFRMNEN